MSDVASAAKLYANVCSEGVSLSDGWLLPRRVVEVQRAVADLDEDRRRVLRYRSRYNDVSCPLPAELPASVSAVMHSPSTGVHTARVVTLDTKPRPRVCLELWRRGSLAARVDGSRLHGKVLCEGTFGGFGWSPCEQKAVYVAECLVPDSPSPFATAAAASLDALLEAPSPGQTHWFCEDWGEKLSGTDRLALFLVDFREMSIRKLPGIRNDITPGQPTFWGEDVVYTGWSVGARRLGALLCLQRPSALYLACLGNERKEHVCLTSGLQVARAPRPAPAPPGSEVASAQANHHAAGGSNSISSTTTSAASAGDGGGGSVSSDGRGMLAFLGSTRGFETHASCLELFVLEPPSAHKAPSPRCLVPVQDAPGHDGFAGICLDSSLPRQCWGGGAIFFNTFVGARETAWRVPAAGDDGPVSIDAPKGAEPMASLSVLAANDEGVLLAWSTPCKPSRVAFRSLADEGDEECLPELGPCAVVAGFPCSGAAATAAAAEGLRWRVQGVSPRGGGARFDALLVEPVQTHKPGLILFAHGGPHSISTTAFDHRIQFLVRSTDCAVLLVNYRGSLGFGRQALESLPGHIGSQDVEDCMAALEAALDTGAFDTDRVAVVGGSHGGFLAAHLIGQHPDVFKAAAMRNPVTNVAAMAASTDIPDWTFVEALGLGSYDFTQGRAPSATELTAMWQRSPCAHAATVRAPTLIALGLKDRRVPPSQGMEYYHSLRSRGVPTRLICYEHEGHALDGPACDADHWINVALWLVEHLPPLQAPPPSDILRATSLGV